MGIKFGLAEYKDKVAGLDIQTLDFDSTCSEAEAMDESGNITQVDQYGFKDIISGTGNIKEGDSLALATGGTLTISNKTYKLNNVKKSVSVSGHQSCSFSGSAPRIITDTSEDSSSSDNP